MTKPFRRTTFALVTAPVVCLAACGAPAEQAQGFQPTQPKVTPTRSPMGVVDDRSMCDYKGRPDREASETAGPGSVQPNVRRVYQIIGTGEDRHKILICREIDTNFDGVKDVVRRYTDKGESLHEDSDSNYDGRLDTWITFAKGHLAEVRLDTNKDGAADEWKFYSNGKLARARRDTNFDGKPDVWEIYRDGALERMGVDLDGDERVDRWDHDTEARRKVEEAERKKDAEAAAKAQEKAEEARKAAEEEAAKDEEAPPPTNEKK